MTALDRERWLAVNPHLDRALEMTEEDRSAWLASLRAEDPTLAADLQTLLELANLSLRTNDLDDAEKHARTAVALAQAFQAGTTHSSWVGLSQLALGRISEARGDPDAARTLYREALTHWHRPSARPIPPFRKPGAAWPPVVTDTKAWFLESRGSSRGWSVAGRGAVRHQNIMAS